MKKDRHIRGTRFPYSHACGQCIACRINNARQWAARLVMESMCHEHALFLTLTYSPEHLPLVNGAPTLNREDSSRFMHRLRKWVLREVQEDLRLRFYLVAEYGGRFGRPHYHVMLFGMPLLSDPLGAQDALAYTGTRLAKEVWKKGHVHVGEVTPESALYVAGYSVAKISRAQREDGSMPEYRTMSTNPGIGSAYAKKLAQALKRANVFVAGSPPPVEDEHEPERLGGKAVPISALRIRGKLIPIGPYMREKIMAHRRQPPLSEIGKALAAQGHDTRRLWEDFLDPTLPEYGQTDPSALRWMRETRQKQSL